MKLSEFLKKLYSIGGNGKNQANFLLDLFTNITLEQSDPFFEKDDADLRKLYNGNRELSKKSATYILSHLDKENFANYLNDILTEDALIELCREFENDIGISTKENILDKLTDLIIKILKNRTKKKDVPQLTATRNYSSFTIEDELTNIVKTLATLPPDKLEDLLTYQPFNVDKKILPENAVLKKDIKKDVVDYYRFVEDLFKEASSSNANFFDEIAEQVKKASDNYISQGLPQGVIFDNMVNWIQNKVSFASTTACRIIISFFVQNCEVFHEITE